ncbi:hypothetical protein F66182_2356 [Fusarium sp. NRRL 66182]|nr:hypothetical protein F66182_2356 [Fusarium sp. NRRL 66182]
MASQILDTHGETLLDDRDGPSITHTNGESQSPNASTAANSNGSSHLNGNGIHQPVPAANGEPQPNGHGHQDTTISPNGAPHLNGNGSHPSVQAVNGDSHLNGGTTSATTFTPMAICGMACRLPAGIHSPQQLWDFLLNKGDARSRIPESRFNIDSFYAPHTKPGATVSRYGYFLDESVDLGALDTSFFSMTRSEVERLDPQQRLLLEVSRECLDDAGEVGWKGAKIGVYVGNYGQDWYDNFGREAQMFGTQVPVTHDFMLANRISYEMDLHGPSMTIRTACSAALIGLNEACSAIAKGDCTSAIVGGTNLITSPALTMASSEHGVLSPDGSCKTFSAEANGYARSEAFSAVFIKPLEDAIRDGNPVRAVIKGIATNSDGKTNGIALPNPKAQEAVIRDAYAAAGISDYSKTGFVECHGTGTAVGDPIEIASIASIFGSSTGDSQMHITSVKPNLGHSEGASGLSSLIKAVLSLENRTIPPNIKSQPLSPKIPFDRAGLVVPTESTPWPAGKDARVSVSAFGIGGSNAHVIIESAERFHVPRRAEKIQEDAPQLLVYSANTPESLKVMVEKYQDFIEDTSQSVADIAHTLANRREHLPYRSFSVVTDGHASIPQAVSSAPVKSKDAPSLVMVFTGQGAQWPQMGRELLRTNSVFSASIHSLDEKLKALGVEWNLRDELVKPTSKSRIGEAEFSQPLCTALQIALVDTFASIGIKPSAVVGHSSGEIAAAYAAGGLSADEAITVAYYRGVTAKKQTRPGRMAAVGLGWDEAEKYLVPGVIIGCDNSPNSVTLSGDADELLAVVDAIKKDQPGVLATILKVEKAYHSHHMAEFGQDYYRNMLGKVSGNTPSKPFFSSVTGALLHPSKDNRELGPGYWQKNLESSVLFRGAVSGILQDSTISNPVFLEIGPHSALSGPLRQILVRESSTAPYISSLTRKQNSAENLLSAIGKLYLLHVEPDFKALLKGDCVPNLPCYPWNHQRSYWWEPRVAKEWRHRKYPYHDLLGVKLPESTDIEPVFRNLFHLDNAPWVRDHKIKDDIIFPFAGYIAMTGEAVRQLTGIQDGFSLRNVLIDTALVIPEGAPTELVTTFRRHRLTDSTESQWWEFVIMSHNGHGWTKHCLGQVRAEAVTAMSSAETPKEQPRQVGMRKWYELSSKLGMHYGPLFRSLEDMTANTMIPRICVAKTRNNQHGDEANYHLHPVVVDACFQLLGVAGQAGLTHDVRRYVPRKVESVKVFRCSADLLTATAVAEPDGDQLVGDGSFVIDSKAVFQVSGAHLARIDDDRLDSIRNVTTTARCEWLSHIDFQDFSTLVRPAYDHSQYSSLLEELTQLAIFQSRRDTSDTIVEAQDPHITKYKTWLDQQTIELANLENNEHAAITGRLEALAETLATTPAAPVAKAVIRVCADITSLLSGSKAALDVLASGDVLDKLNEFIAAYDNSAFIRSIGLSKPNLRVLELGGGHGVATQAILGQLTRSNAPLYSLYVFSDTSAGRVGAAKERFKGIPNMEFTALDINKDFESQGFQEGDFDLIIASGVLHRATKINDSLVNLRKLLRPSGRLLFQEPRPGVTWLQYVLGTLPGWWSGVEESRADEPFLSAGRWEEELKAAGFEGLDGQVQDAPEPHSLNNIMVAKPQRKVTQSKLVTILHDAASEKTSNPLVRELEARGYTISYSTLAENPPSGQDIISLLDEERPFFEDMDATKFEQLRNYINQLGSAGLLWLTKSSSTQHCHDPRYAQAIGFARTMRSEEGVDFATCETDDLDSSQAIVDVFDRFNARQDDGVLGPDLEYAICDGVIRVNRFFPFDLEDEARVSDPSDEAVLKIAKPGRIDSLYWGATSHPPPQGDEVELEVHAVGLNFRDILVAMGLIPLPELTFGYEAAGIVTRVGPKVTKVRVGDRAIGASIKVFATKVTDTELLFEKIPDSLSFVDGASLGLVFSTAIYSLIDIGRLEKGKSVLIHSGAGGVGQAAIQIAQMIGADVYTTVGNEEKVKYLMETFNLPREHIFDSRSESFVDDLMRATNNKGADVVLNSLSGELLHATWRCVAKWGSMVEIGKRDLLGSGKLDMSVFLANRSYCCVDMDQMRSERPWESDRLLHQTIELYRQGHIKPIRVAKTFAASAIQETFRTMQQGTHIGKVVVQVRDSAGEPQLGQVQSMRENPVIFDGAASYLLVGGLGGLGRSISVWMAMNGARNLTFLSRSAGNGPHDQGFVEELRSMGCTVQMVRGSVLNPDDVARAVDSTPAPLKGIIQMSMVLRDQSYQRMTVDDWNTCVAPKVQGTWNLHNVTVSHKEKLDLDFFVLFSSLSGIIGQVGQANYASANTFLDAFAHYRQSMGLPCSAIDIGAMEGVGYLFENEELLRKMQGSGWRSVQEGQLLKALGVAMMPKGSHQQPEDDTLVDRNNFLLGISPTTPLSDPSSSARLRKDVRMAVYHNEGVNSASKSAASDDALSAFLSSAKSNPALLKAPEAGQLIAREIGKKMLAMLLKSNDNIDISQSLTELGLDSMIAVEMRAWWRITFGSDISVLEMLGMGTLEALGKRAAEELAVSYSA